INNTSSYTNVGYQDFRNTDTLRVMPGDQIALTPSLSSVSGYGYSGFMAWVDWNHDGDFDDPGETVGSIPQQDISMSFTCNFSVPIVALPGHTTMRVMAAEYIDNFDPCGDDIISYYYSWGEAEDYTVIIDSLPSCAT